MCSDDTAVTFAADRQRGAEEVPRAMIERPFASAVIDRNIGCNPGDLNSTNRCIGPRYEQLLVPTVGITIW